MQPFVAGPDLKQYWFSLSSFETDSHDVTNLAFARGQELGKFDFEIDQVEIK